MNLDDKLFPEAWDPVMDYYRDRDPEAFLKRWEGVAPEVRGFMWLQSGGYIYTTADWPTNMTYDPGTTKIET